MHTLPIATKYVNTSQTYKGSRQTKTSLRGFVIAVLLLSALYFLPTRSVQAAAARIFLNPTEATGNIGSTFVTEVIVATESEIVNAVSLELIYPNGLIELQDAQTIGTAFPLAPAAPKIDAARGRVSFEAGAPGGFQGQGGVLRLVWLVKEAGSADIGFGDGTQLLRHSPTAEPIELGKIGGSYQLVRRDVTLPVITSDDHPDEAQWYNVPFVRMAWDAKPGAAYSYVLSRLSNEEPDEAPDEPVGDIKLSTPEDGVFYFHLRECTGPGKCGPTVTRRAMKDATPPAPFSLLLGQSDEAYSGKRFVSFATTDATSGVARYEVAEGATSGATWEQSTGTYILREQAGDTSVWVRAYDQAGNYREVTLDVLGTAGGRWQWLVSVVVLALIVLILIVRHRKRSNSAAINP